MLANGVVMQQILTLSGRLFGTNQKGEEDCSDPALMRRITEGDEAAYRMLVERHIHKMFALANRILHNHDDAEDVVQDAFLKIWTNRENWNHDGAKVTTWLYRVVTNRCIDIKRKPASASIDAVAEPRDERPNAPAQIESRQAKERLKAAVSNLPEKQQTALMMFYQEGMSNQEVSEIMGISVNAVHSLLKRARQQLRVYLKDNKL